MPRSPGDRVRKHPRLRPDVLARAQAALGTSTETDTIEQALRLAAGEVRPSTPDDPAARAATGHGILKLFGSIPPHEADAMIQAIEEGCERIDGERFANPLLDTKSPGELLLTYTNAVRSPIRP